MLRNLRVNVLIVSYRGFGKSEGTPGEPGLVYDAHATLDYIKTRDDIDQHSLFLFGRSLGTAVATHLAYDRPNEIKALVCTCAVCARCAALLMCSGERVHID